MGTQTTNADVGVILSTIDRTCTRLGLGRTSVYGLLKSGDLKAVKFGSATRVTEESIQRLVERRLAAARDDS